MIREAQVFIMGTGCVSRGLGGGTGKRKGEEGRKKVNPYDLGNIE